MELKYEYSERFCLNSKCGWQGHRVTNIGKLCPQCGSKTSGFAGNDGFTMTGPQSNKQWPPVEYPIDYEPYEETRSQFIRPMNQRYILGPDVKTDLPKNYHYSSMWKIKAGKGYRRDGHPVGVIGHQCPECTGHIISIQMCTSSRGFTTTSEKVCDTCGLIVPGSFQILEKIDEPYRGRHTETHEEWIQQNTPDLNYDDVDAELEWSSSLNGYRPNTEDAKGYGEKQTTHYVNPKYAERIEKLEWKYKHTPMKTWRELEYIGKINGIGEQIGISRYHIIILSEMVEKHGIKYFNRRLSYEEIITQMCLYFKGDDINTTIKNRMEVLI